MRRATMSSDGRSGQHRPTSARGRSLGLPSLLPSLLLPSLFLVICGCGDGVKLVEGIPVDAGAAEEVGLDDAGNDAADDDAGDAGGAEDGTISANDGGEEADASNPDTQ